jgi:hypothetical protein
MISLTIDGKEVESRRALPSSRRLRLGNIDIPTLCHDPRHETPRRLPALYGRDCRTAAAGPFLHHPGDRGHGGRDNQRSQARAAAQDQRLNCCSPIIPTTAWSASVPETAPCRTWPIDTISGESLSGGRAQARPGRQQPLRHAGAEQMRTLRPLRPGLRRGPGCRRHRLCQPRLRMRISARRFKRDLNCEFCGQCISVCPTGALSAKMWAGRPRHEGLRPPRLPAAIAAAAATSPCIPMATR